MVPSVVISSNYRGSTTIVIFLIINLTNPSLLLCSGESKFYTENHLIYCLKKIRYYKYITSLRALICDKCWFCIVKSWLMYHCWSRHLWKKVGGRTWNLWIFNYIRIIFKYSFRFNLNIFKTNIIIINILLTKMNLGRIKDFNRYVCLYCM